MMEKKIFQIGEAVFKEGDAATNAYLIRSGKVKITKTDKDGRPRTLTTLGKGEIIGEMALIDNSARSATATADDLTEVLEITKDDFQKRLQTSDQVIGLLMQTFTKRLREQAARLAGL